MKVSEHKYSYIYIFIYICVYIGVVLERVTERWRERERSVSMLVFAPLHSTRSRLHGLSTLSGLIFFPLCCSRSRGKFLTGVWASKLLPLKPWSRLVSPRWNGVHVFAMRFVMRFQRLVAIGLRIVLIMLLTKYLQTCMLLCGAQMNSKTKTTHTHSVLREADAFQIGSILI